MSAASDMHESEDRDGYGYPPLSEFCVTGKPVIASDGAVRDTVAPTVKDIHAPLTGDFSNRKNDALPWVALTLIFGVLSLGMIVTTLVAAPAYIDAKIKAGIAEAKAELAQPVADAKAAANTAREHARVALDKVEQTQTQLGARGLIKVDTH